MNLIPHMPELVYPRQGLYADHVLDQFAKEQFIFNAVFPYTSDTYQERIEQILLYTTHLLIFTDGSDPVIEAVCEGIFPSRAKSKIIKLR